MSGASHSGVSGKALHPPTPCLAIVPAKRLSAAKSRLSGVLDGTDRSKLMLAMLTDVLMNLRRCELVERTVVVTDDREIRHRAVAEGAEVVADEDSPSHSAAALRGIAAAAHPDQRVLLAPGDCPLLRVEDLDALLSRARPRPSLVVVPDRAGLGTNALLVDPPDAVEPSFGEGSHARHLALAEQAGVAAFSEPIASLALDVDTPEDLAALRARLATMRGHAPATRGVLQTLRG